MMKKKKEKKEKKKKEERKKNESQKKSNEAGMKREMRRLACPLEVATANAPPSKAATLFSKASVVGFINLV